MPSMISKDEYQAILARVEARLRDRMRELGPDRVREIVRYIVPNTNDDRD